ncbi:MAG: DUF4340 domain-containing protein [Bacteroidales bacterium]|nr:DUF4340 domain-containing protein [Bacteroidales bacterium]
MLSKILNTKTLIILLAILVIIYIISNLSDSGERTFKSELVTIDTADITSIIIQPKIGGGDEIKLTRTGYDWKLESGDKIYDPDKNAANNILSELIKIKPERVAATDDSKWKQYEVTDSTGTRVLLKKKNKVVADLYVGKFSYAQAKNAQPNQRQQGKMTTYVRLADEKEVYAVEGFLKMTIQSDVNAYRNNTLININKNDLTKLEFTYPDKSFTLMKLDNKWVINGVLADSAKTAKYFNSLARVISSNFIDDVNPTSSLPEYSLEIEGNNFAPIEIKAFPADTTNKYIITSSINQGAKFSGAKSNLFEKIFTQQNTFFSEN